MDRCRRFYDQQLDLATPREWTDLVPRALLADVAREHGGDRAAGKLTAPVHFWVLVVAALSQRLRQHHFGAGWLRKAWQQQLVALEALDSSTFRLMARLRHVFTPTGSGGAKKGGNHSK